MYSFSTLMPRPRLHAPLPRPKLGPSSLLNLQSHENA